VSRPLDEHDVPVYSERAHREAVAAAVAAERERIIRLARHVHASYAADPHQAMSVLREFADLIEGDTP